MSSKIDSREVLSYLNQLGYKNIDAQQLQAFIKDLKKLMKYEERKSYEPEIIKVNILRTLDLDEKENIVSNSDVNSFKGPTSQFSTAVELNLSKNTSPVRRPSTQPSQYPTLKGENKQNVSLESYSHSTVACPVHIFEENGCSKIRRSKAVGTACTCPKDAYSQVPNVSLKDKNNKRAKRPVSSTSESKADTNTISSFPNNFDDKVFSRYYPSGKKTKKVTTKSHTHDFTHPCHCCDSSRPRSAVIKCNVDPKPAFPKCDPVNLHKYYQRQWKLNNIPGENMSREQRFRWCFREKISCGPPVYGGLNFRYLPKFGFGQCMT